jgi:glucosamine--fructose-6-phosphate aminotransferase (isomerizing)
MPSVDQFEQTWQSRNGPVPLPITFSFRAERRHLPLGQCVTGVASTSRSWKVSFLIANLRTDHAPLHTRRTPRPGGGPRGHGSSTPQTTMATGMCGIIGCVGLEPASDVLIRGLKRLEYRGYDSAGVAVMNGSGLQLRKVAGRVAGLEALLSRQPAHGTTGIGHTRWATHGPPTEPNAHPHIDSSGRIALVHNGIIENADALRAWLQAEGHCFRTPTDTEVIAHLIESSAGETLEERVLASLPRLEGTFGLAVISSDEPDKIVAARRGSPVLLGVGDGGQLFVASDPSAILHYTRSVVYLEDNDVAVLTPSGYEIWDHEGQGLDRTPDSIDWDLGAIELGDYAHFMLKEIFEQPRSLADSLRGRLLPDDGSTRLLGLNMEPHDVASLKRIVILACGTSWHAGLVGRYVLEELTGLPVQVEYASEFRYRTPLPLQDTLALVISQSGETADTLEALHRARESGARVLGIVNMVGSSIARAADGGIYLHAGPEIGVASTKAFTSQVSSLLLLALFLGRLRGLPLERGAALVNELQRIPDLIQECLELNDQVLELAREFGTAQNFLYLGRGINFPVALEGALKLKEVSYIHAEGYPAAELKHGPLALIDKNMPAVFVAPRDAVYRKVLSNIQEVKARGGRTVVVTSRSAESPSRLADYELRVPDTTSPLLSPLLTVIPLQLLSYHVAVLRGCDVDRPRNLAKSVTVE